MKMLELIKILSTKDPWEKKISWEIVNRYFNNIEPSSVIEFYTDLLWNFYKIDQYLALYPECDISRYSENLEYYYPKRGVEKLLLAIQPQCYSELREINGLWRMIFDAKESNPRWKKLSLKDIIVTEIGENPGRFYRELEEYTTRPKTNKLRWSHGGDVDSRLRHYSYCENGFFGQLMEEINMVFPVQYGRIPKFLNYRHLQIQLGERCDNGVWKLFFDSYHKVPEWKEKSTDEIVYGLVGPERKKYWNEWRKRLLEGYLLDKYKKCFNGKYILYPSTGKDFSVYAVLSMMKNELSVLGVSFSQ